MRQDEQYSRFPAIKEEDPLSLQRILFYFFTFLALPFPPLHALGQKILNLPVHRAKVVLRPDGELVKQRVGNPKRHLFFLIF